MTFERTEGEFMVSSDAKKLDLDVVHGFLKDCYWARGIPRAVVQRSLQNSLCFGVYHGRAQVGFARVITDRTTFAYLADVFILESHRKRGLGKFLMRCIMQYPELQGLRRWSLITRDAHQLYRQFGFQPLARPETWMELHNPDVYTRQTTNESMSK
jgi:GNAT superfamily N-acetyltransferase